ncbi:MAG: TetR/AcrR family transcriptional regulator [Dehalococcoidia bacterium]|nr:TetR/AcrR family transcriptional regulator [Dehalococcoidia bacterium]
MVKEIQSSIKNHELLAKRREEIVMTSSKLFMRKGFERTSVREIAKACGLTVGGLYRYVGSKDDILWLTTVFGDFAGENLLDGLRQQVRGLQPIDALRESIIVYFRSVNEYQDLYNFHNHVVWTATKDFRKTIFTREIDKIDYFKQLVEQGIKSGDFVTDDARLVAHNIVIAGNAWANRRWYLREFYTLDEYIKKEIEYVLTAIHSKRSDLSTDNSGSGCEVKRNTDFENTREC